MGDLQTLPVHTTSTLAMGSRVYTGSSEPLDVTTSRSPSARFRSDTAPTRTVVGTDGWSSGLNPASFAQDSDGELFIVDVRTASIYKLVPAN